MTYCYALPVKSQRGHRNNNKHRDPEGEVFSLYLTVAESNYSHIHSDPSGFHALFVACVSHLLAFLVQSNPLNT